MLLKDEGIGWNLIIDTSNRDFPVVIGGEGYSTEITKTEWQTLVPSIVELIDQFESYKNTSVGDEPLILEIKKESLTACLEGLNDEWALNLRFEGDRFRGRGFHMYWPIPSAKAFSSAMRIMWDSYQ